MLIALAFLAGVFATLVAGQFLRAHDEIIAEMDRTLWRSRVADAKWRRRGGKIARERGAFGRGGGEAA